MGKAPECLGLGADHVQPPDCERPRHGNGLECLSWHVGLPSVELAPFTGAHDLIGVGDRRWPVEPLAKGVPNQGLWSGMVSANPAVDVD